MFRLDTSGKIDTHGDRSGFLTVRTIAQKMRGGEKYRQALANPPRKRVIPCARPIDEASDRA
jgi:hypothetical protein